MCFSLKISLATAIIEFLVVAYFALVYKKSILIKLLIFFIFFLGMYQFSLLFALAALIGVRKSKEFQKK